MAGKFEISAENMYTVVRAYPYIFAVIFFKNFELPYFIAFIVIKENKFVFFPGIKDGNTVIVKINSQPDA